MKSLIFITLMLVFAQGATLQNVSMKASERGIEMLFSLDSSFYGRTIKRDSGDFTAIVFKGLNYYKDKLATNSKLVKNIEIFAQDNDLVVVFGERDFDLNFNLEVLNARNALKIVITPKPSIAQNLFLNNTQEQTSLEASINALKAQNNLTTLQMPEPWRYALVVAILIALILALLIVKKRTQNPSDAKSNLPYFRRTPLAIAQTLAIDMKNKIVVLDSKEADYILFVGQSGAFIIDKIPKLTRNMMEENANKKIIENMRNKEGQIAHVLKAYKGHEWQQ